MQELGTTRKPAAIADRLAICAHCEHYSLKQFEPLMPRDGYCARLACRSARKGLAYYVSVGGDCPEQVWREHFRRRRAARKRG